MKTLKLILILIILFNINLQVKAQTCTGLQTLSTCSGAFNDGSGSSNYSDNLVCGFLIQPPNSTNVTATLTNFSTEQGYDFLYAYDGPNSFAPFIGSYSGTLGTFSISSTNGPLYLLFESDNSTTSTGWNCSYVCTGGVGLDELNDLITFNAYPNPNQGNFSIDLEFNTATEAQIDLVNVHGAIVKSWAKQMFSRSVNLPVSIDGLADGIYNLNISTSNGIANKSIVVKK